jgi:hypothetical protein
MTSFLRRLADRRRRKPRAVVYHNHLYFRGTRYTRDTVDRSFLLWLRELESFLGGKVSQHHRART